MNRNDLVFAIISVFLGLVIGFAVGLFLINPHTGHDQSAKTVTVEKAVPGPETTVEKTVPGPERTVYKRKPGITTWIIVCGENTQRVVNNKPTTECNLPDTGGPLRRHKAH